MAIALDLIFPTSTVSLSDGNPYRLDGATDLSPAEVIRLVQHSPTQDGVTDQGYRLAPRVATLNLLFYATTDALLDTYRANLFYYFKPLTDTPLTLRYTRDDGTYRYLSCVAVDEIPIEIVPENRPGHLHRATIKLRAANPAWSSAAKTATFSGSALDWWTAGGRLGSANVMEHVEFPTQGQAWTYAGTITGSWSVAARSRPQSGTGTATMFHAGTGAIDAVSADAFVYYKSPYFYMGNGDVAFTDFSGTHNYTIATGTNSGFQLTRSYYDHEGQAGLTTDNQDISGTARRWRSDRLGSASSYWTAELEKAAVYDIELTPGQIAILSGWMAGTAVLGTVSAVNLGDLPEYPYITITGPITNPILTNNATGAIIDLTGVTLGSAQTISIDLRTGDKLIANASGSSIIGSVPTPMQLAAFYLAPSPTAASGANSIQVDGGSVGATTSVVVTYYDRYMSY